MRMSYNKLWKLLIDKKIAADIIGSTLLIIFVGGAVR